jgi:phosphodiesterase/alkaline phosphatase D-like protein
MRRLAALGTTTLALLASALVLTTAPALAATAPSVTTGASSAVGNTQASLAGTVNPQGQLTSYAFQYGTTASYGQQTALTSAGSGSADVPVAASLSALTPGTGYHYRVIATNGTGTTVGADHTFTTTGTAPPAPPLPTVTTGTASVTGTIATLTGAVNPNGVATSYYFELGTTSAYGQQTPPQDAGSGTQAVSVATTTAGLKANVTYHYRLVAVGPGGAVALGSDATFSTAATPTRIAFFGKTSFADQHGVGGVFLGCFGTTGCTGTSVTFSRSGKVLATRTKFTLGSNDGGFVHVTLNALGQSLLRHRGTMNVNTTVVNTNGQKVSGTLKLIRYSTTGLKN